MNGIKAPDRRAHFIFAIIAFFLVLQFAIPLVQAGRPGSHRWGWQMYSRYPTVGEYTAVLHDGSVHEMALDDHLFSRRFELKPNTELINQLCTRAPGAMAIRVSRDESNEIEEFQCDDS